MQSLHRQCSSFISRNFVWPPPPGTQTATAIAKTAETAWHLNDPYFTCFMSLRMLNVGCLVCHALCTPAQVPKQGAGIHELFRSHRPELLIRGSDRGRVVSIVVASADKVMAVFYGCAVALRHELMSELRQGAVWSMERGAAVLSISWRVSSVTCQHAFPLNIYTSSWFARLAGKYINRSIHRLIPHLSSLAHRSVVSGHPRLSP
jgi:hypothetical protein